MVSYLLGPRRLPSSNLGASWHEILTGEHIRCYNPPQVRFALLGRIG